MFKLRSLPFDISSNNVISEDTCNFHYGKHHKSYVDNLNNLIKGTDFENKSLFEILVNSSGAIFNNAAQIYNHDFYWDCISKKSEPSKELQEALKDNFSDFKSEFIKAASTLFGSGWCWLVYNTKSDKLEIVQTSNAQTPVTDLKIPLLVVDVWEHAYYIDFKNTRASYLEKFYDNIDWEFVSSAFIWAKKEGMGSVEFYIKDIHKNDTNHSCCCC